MKKRNFLGPAYVLAAIGVVQIGFSYGIYHRVMGSVWNGKLVLSFALFPVVYLLEALVYYFIRRRHYAHKWAWWHVGLLLIQRFLINMVLFWMVSNIGVMGWNRGLTLFSQITFFSAHCFFVMALAGAFRQKKEEPPSSGSGEESPHLLDEILDDPTMNLR